MNHNKIISSAANPQYKQLKKIAHQARERKKQQTCLLDGVHLLTSLADSKLQPTAIFYLENIAEKNSEIAHCLSLFPDTPATQITAELFHAISPVDTPTGILALCNIPKPTPKEYSFVILLERLQDPGNLGSILRTITAGGAEAVYLSQDCVDAWSPKVLRAGMGAHFLIDIYEHCDLVALAQTLPRLYATSLTATDNLYDMDLTGTSAFAFGNEGSGLSEELLAVANSKIQIPMLGKTESLNVAAAAAICTFERVRQLKVTL